VDSNDLNCEELIYEKCRGRVGSNPNTNLIFSSSTTTFICLSFRRVSLGMSLSLLPSTKGGHTIRSLPNRR
jgi:hypothetical protein